MTIPPPIADSSCCWFCVVDWAKQSRPKQGNVSRGESARDFTPVPDHCQYEKLDRKKFSARFEDQALVAGAASDLFAVEIFEQGDGVFAGDAREIFEGGDVDEPIGFVL